MPPQTLQKKYITRNGLEKLKKEHHYLIGPGRALVAQRIQNAREDGEVEENLEYKYALQEKELLEIRVQELDLLLRSAVAVEKRRTSRVEIGNTILVEAEGERIELTLVGSEEADPGQGLISYESQVGSSLLGAKAGDVIVVNCSIKTVYKVISIK